MTGVIVNHYTKETGAGEIALVCVKGGGVCLVNAAEWVGGKVELNTSLGTDHVQTINMVERSTLIQSRRQIVM